MFVLVSQGYDLLLDGIHGGLLEFSLLTPELLPFYHIVRILTKLIHTPNIISECVTKVTFVGIGALTTRSPLWGVLTSL